MARQIIQSAIREVRDQLMLDTADGSYLNVVTSNVGLERPKYGLSDDEWRAIAKVLGLSYKQIRTKFEEILSIIYGPKVTLFGSLKNSIAAGESILYLHSTEGMPQVGTLVLDKGLPNEEAISYSFIDRTNDAIYLDKLTTYGHIKCLVDVDKPLVVDRPAGSTTLIFSDVDQFPTSYPFSLLLDRGLDTEETVIVYGADVTARTLTCSPTLYGHSGSTPGSEYSLVRSDYVQNTYMISAKDLSAFPPSGEIFLAEPPVYQSVSGSTDTLISIPGGSIIADTLIGKSVLFHGNVTSSISNEVRTIVDNTDNLLTLDSALSGTPVPGDMFYVVNTYTSTGGTPTSVSAGSSFKAKELTGYKIVFVGNVTAGLQGVSRDIESNTASIVTLSAPLLAAPIAGDVFYILPKVEYVRASYDENVFILKRAVYASILKGTKIELLNRSTTGALGQVQILGTGWDVFQADPRVIEIILPNEITEKKDVRSTSYIHDKYITVPAATLTVEAVADDTSLTLNTLEGWPMAGVVVIDSVKNFGFTRRTITDLLVSVDSSFKTITVNTGGLVVDSLVGQDISVGEGFSGTVVSNTADTITFSQIIPNNVIDSFEPITPVVFVDPYIIDIPNEVVSATYAIGVSATLYQPTYALSQIINGNFRSVNDTYPGPYLYDEKLDAPMRLQNVPVLAQRLAGPTRVVVSQSSSGRALEVEDASFFPLSGFPYSALIESKIGSSEFVEITGVYLKQQVGVSYSPPSAPERVTISASTAGDDFIVISTAAGATQNSSFPQANGYRVLLDRGGANEEVAWIRGVTGPTQLSCEALINDHAAGETIELLSDVVTVSFMANNHFGAVSTSDKKSRWPSYSSDNILSSDVIRVQYGSIALNSTTGMDQTSSSVILNFGDNSTPVSSKIVNNPNLPILSTKFIVESADAFPQPTTSGYPMVLSKGTVNEETVIVTNVDISLDEITILRPTQKVHTFGDKAVFNAYPQETIQYSTTVSDTLSFSQPIMLQSNHHINEPAVGSEAKSIPKVNGYDFPFRMPPNLFDQLHALFDMVRAAGVQVTIIEQR